MKFNIVSSNFFNNHLTYIIVKCLLNIHEKSGYHIQSLFFCKYRTINLQDVLVCMEGHFCKKATKSTKLFTLRILMKATAICHSPSFRKSLCLESLETIMQYLQRWKMFHILNRERLNTQLSKSIFNLNIYIIGKRKLLLVYISSIHSKNSALFLKRDAIH